MESKSRVERHFRPDQVAELLALSRSFVYYLISSGELAAVSFGKGKGRPRALRIPESSIENYLRRLRDGA
jgi:excisionase family DNA binding protein